MSDTRLGPVNNEKQVDVFKIYLGGLGLGAKGEGIKKHTLAVTK